MAQRMEGLLMTRTSNKHKYLIFPFWTLFFLIGAVTAEAATYYVATTGNDAHVCATAQTITTPKRTIRSGITCLKPGDKLYIRTGTYTESIDTNQAIFPSGTSWATAVTLAAYPGEKVTFKGYINFAKLLSYIIVSDLIIDAINTTMGDAVSINQGSHHIRFQNCEVKNAYSNGVGIWWGNINGLPSNYNEFINCEIHHNGRAGGPGFPNQPPGYGRGHALYITTQNNVFRGNRVHDNGEYGFHVYCAAYPAKPTANNIIERNIIYKNGLNTTRYGKVCCGGIVLMSGSGNMALNNVVYNHPARGIDVGTTGTNVKVYNNTFYNNGLDIQALSGGSGYIQNNIAYPRGISIVGGYVTSNNLTTDPRFVNPAAGDFNLQLSSPAIDKGVPLSQVKLDIRNYPRPRRLGQDIGAYEVQ
jgi:parallel beta-helix repeat protein